MTWLVMVRGVGDGQDRDGAKRGWKARAKVRSERGHSCIPDCRDAKDYATSHRQF